MSETPLSQQDQADLDSLGIQLEDAEPKRSLLEVWRELLGKGVDEAADEPIPVYVAAKVVASWPFLTFQETAKYHQFYHSLIRELRVYVNEIIDEHPDALGFVGDDDAEHNHVFYRDILVAWHNHLDTYEQEWRAEDPVSHIWAAVIPDVRAFLFSSVGLAGHLDSIGFVMADDEFLDAVKQSREEQGE